MTSLSPGLRQHVLFKFFFYKKENALLFIWDLHSNLGIDLYLILLNGSCYDPYKLLPRCFHFRHQIYIFSEVVCFICNNGATMFTTGNKKIILLAPICWPKLGCIFPYMGLLRPGLIQHVLFKFFFTKGDCTIIHLRYALQSWDRFISYFVEWFMLWPAEIIAEMFSLSSLDLSFFWSSLFYM